MRDVGLAVGVRFVGSRDACSRLISASMKSCCSRSLVKLMQSCSKLFILKFSKPKMSSSPMLYESSCWSDARRPAGPPIPAPASAAFSRATM